MTTLLPTTLPNKDAKMHFMARSLVVVYMMGNLFEIVLIVIVSVLFLQAKGHTIASSKMAAPPSYDNYGLFWGCTTVSLVGSCLLTAYTIAIIKINLSSGVPMLILTGMLVLALLLIGIVASLIVAIHYGRKLDLITPSIFLWPFAILFCNRANQISKKIVQILSLWSLLLFIHHISCYASYIFLALLARPHTVISTSLLYIFAIFCTIHFLAIIFTTTKMKKTVTWKKHKIPLIAIHLVQVLMFTFLFATAVCFGLMIGAAGTLANYGVTRHSPNPILSNFVTPLALALFGWTLRKVGMQWLKLHTPSSSRVHMAVGEELPLLQELKKGLTVRSEPLLLRSDEFSG